MNPNCPTCGKPMTRSEHGAGASTYVCCGQKYPFTLPTSARPAMTSEVAAMARPVQYDRNILNDIPQEVFDAEKTLSEFFSARGGSWEFRNVCSRDHATNPAAPTSRFTYGDAVIFDLGTGRPGIPAFVRSITFSTGKVRYAIWVPEASTTLQNIDSSFIQPNPGQPSKDFSGEDQ